MAMRNIKLDRKDLMLIADLLDGTIKYDDIVIHGYDHKLASKLRKEAMGIKRATAKAKGLGLQMKVCELISRVTGIEWVQGSDDSLIFSRLSGQSGTDVGLRGTAKKLFPFSIECKNTESFSINSVVEQAKANSTPEMPMLIVHKNKALAEPIYMVEESTFERIIQPYVEANRGSI